MTNAAIARMQSTTLYSTVSIKNVMTLPSQSKDVSPVLHSAGKSLTSGTSLVTQIMHYLVSTRTWIDVLHTITELLSQYFDANFICVMVRPHQAASSLLEVMPGVVMPDAVIEGLRYWNSMLVDLPPGLWGPSCTSEFQNNPRLNDFTRSLKQIGHVTGMNQSLGLITAYQGQVNGFMGLFRKTDQIWQPQEMVILQEISDVLALAIAQVQYHRSHEVLERYNTLTHQITLATQQATELEPILDTTLQGIPEILHIDRGCVLRFRKSANGQLKATIARSWPLPDPPQHEKVSSRQGHVSYLVSNCAISQAAVIQSPESLVIPHFGQWLQDTCDIKADETCPNASILSLAPDDSLLITPLVSKRSRDSEGILGLLILQRHHTYVWSQSEINLVEQLAAQLSTAILQTQTLQQVQALVDERTAQLQGSLEMQARLYEKTRQQVAQLHHLNQLKDEFLSTISHELRTPLTSMRLAIQMLQEADLAPQQQRYLRILQTQCLQEAKLVNDLLALRELETDATELQFECTDLNSLIASLVDMFEMSYEERGLTLHTSFKPEIISLHTDPSSLRRILVELLTNAGKYATLRSQVRLQVYRNDRASIPALCMNVTNLGPEITTEERPYIFDKFRRGQGVTKQAIQGTGLGLALVKNLVQHLGGQITVSSRLLDGENLAETCFSVILPLNGG